MSARHARPGLLAIALVFAFGTSCFPIKREPRTSIAVAGGYSEVEHQSLSCGGPTPIQRQRQYGGTAEVRHEGARGWQFGGRAVGLYGRFEEGVHLMRDRDRDRYFLLGLGVFGGYDLHAVGIEQGALALVYTTARSGEEMVFFSPWLKLWAGDHDLMSVEGQVGSSTGFLFDTRLFALGLALRRPWFEAHAGLGYGGRMIIDQDGDDEDTFLIGSRHQLDWTVYLEGEVQIVPQLRLTAGGQFGQQWPTFLIGLRYDLGG